MKQYLLSTLESSKNYTLAVAEAMPENDYAYKPVPDVWSFHQQIEHIAYGIGWWQENFIKGNKTDWAPISNGKTREDALQYLSRAYSELKASIENAIPGDELIKGFAATLDHITHHRGQAIIYLRSRGILAPEYVY